MGPRASNGGNRERTMGGSTMAPMPAIKTSERIKLANNTYLEFSVLLGGDDELDVLEITLSSCQNADSHTTMSVFGIAPSEVFDVSTLLAKLGARFEAKRGVF